MKWLLTFCLCGGLFTARGQTYGEQAVAAVLMGEAWSEGIRGMTAVAEVIHKRAAEKDETPLQVVAMHRGRIHAFSCLNGATISQLIQKFSAKRAFLKALGIAEKVCEDPAHLPDLTNSANHYTRTTERPYWARGKRPVAVIGHHAFYKLKYY